MSCESRVDDALKNLGYKIEIRYWSIASEGIMRQGIFLRSGLTMAVLKEDGKIPSESERLMREVMGGTRESMHDFRSL